MPSSRVRSLNGFVASLFVASVLSSTLAGCTTPSPQGGTPATATTVAPSPLGTHGASPAAAGASRQHIETNLTLTPGATPPCVAGTCAGSTTGDFLVFGAYRPLSTRLALSAFWNATTPLDDGLNVSYWTPGGGDRPLASATGASPLRIHLENVSLPRGQYRVGFSASEGHATLADVVHLVIDLS
ncbi:MAG: hypothetical protein ACYDCK_14825 [Thermoplasmatota archaeon]